jgi:hypothetical protein
MESVQRLQRSVTGRHIQLKTRPQQQRIARSFALSTSNSRSTQYTRNVFVKHRSTPELRLQTRAITFWSDQFFRFTRFPIFQLIDDRHAELPCIALTPCKTHQCGIEKPSASQASNHRLDNSASPPQLPQLCTQGTQATITVIDLMPPRMRIE